MPNCHTPYSSYPGRRRSLSLVPPQQAWRGTAQLGLCFTRASSVFTFSSTLISIFFPHFLDTLGREGQGRQCFSEQQKCSFETKGTLGGLAVVWAAVELRLRSEPWLAVVGVSGRIDPRPQHGRRTVDDGPRTTPRPPLHTLTPL